MASIQDGVYANLIQGVSQQTPLKRLAGQLTEQVNMVSDPTTGLRRRHGFELVKVLAQEVPEHCKWFHTSVSGSQYAVALDYVRGYLYVHSIRGELLGSIQSDYMIGQYADFNITSVAGFGVVLNTGRTIGIDNFTADADKQAAKGAFVHVLEGGADLSGNVVTAAYHTNGKLRVSLTRYKTGDGVQSSDDNKTYIWVHHVILENINKKYMADVVDYLLTSFGKLDYNTSGKATTGNTQIVVDKHRPTVNQTGVDKHGLYLTGLPVDFFADGIIRPYLEIDLQSVRATQVSHGTTLPTVGSHHSAIISQRGIAEIIHLGLDLSPVGVSVNVSGGTVFVKPKDSTVTDVLMVTDAGEVYVTASGKSNRVSTADKLPNVLPSQGAGYVLAVGKTQETLAYYVYTSQGTWEEVPANNSKVRYTNMPLLFEVIAPNANALRQYNDSIAVNEESEPTWDFPRWSVSEFIPKYNVINSSGNVEEVQGWPAILSGNLDNNPYAHFAEYGITGIGSYQNRLVLLSGSYIHLSDSNNLFVFTRKTVTEQLDTECIHVQSLNSLDASFKYALEFNKDLVLFSTNQQVTIPAPQQALTSKNIRVHNSAVAYIGMEHPPCIIGKDLYYANTNNLGYVQLAQLQVNNLVDNQFNPVILSTHIPQYYKGTSNAMAGSSTSGCLFISNASNEILTWQFMVDGEAQQSAFSVFRLPTDVDVRELWVIGDSLYVPTFYKGRWCMLRYVCTLGRDDTPYLDLWYKLSTMRNYSVDVLTLPERFLSSEALIADVPSALNGLYDTVVEPDTGTVSANSLIDHITVKEHIVLDKSYKGGAICIGKRYPSSFEPSPVIHKDYDSNIGYQGNFAVLAFVFNVKQSCDFTVQLKAGQSEWKQEAISNHGHTAKFSTGLSATSNFRMPVRQVGLDTIRVSTESTLGLNVVEIGWTAKVHRPRAVYR